jgi:predicted DNA-binding protein/8-oxo-dGTP pyrophosphatase MutT (NUDIX family)
MPRKTKILGFSLPAEVHDQLENLLKKKHKTRSEFIRELIDSYSDSVRQISSEDKDSKFKPGETPNLAKILRSYWDARSLLPLKVIVVGLGIIVDKNGRVLIGAREEIDPYVKNLSWVFPGGAMDSLDFETELKRKIMNETGILVSINSLISTRIHPDAFFKKAQVITLYFHCTPATISQAKADNGLSELKWVQPTEAHRYFTNSTNDDVARFLSQIEEGS